MVQKTREALQAFIDETKKSQRQVAKELGLSATVITQFISGSYAGNNSEVAARVNSYLTVSKQRLNSVKSAHFYEGLYNTQEVLYAASYAHRMNDITLVCGDAGAGKTTALKHYADNNAGVIFITANSCTTSASAVMGLICRAIGRQFTGRRDMIMDSLIQMLEGTNRLIIVDEADHLSLEALQALRNINDCARVGIVLAGNEKIYNQMRYGRRSPQFQQLRTRIIVRKWVHHDYSVDEIGNLFPGADAACCAQLLKLATAESLRTARKLYDIALGNATGRGQPLSAKLLKTTQEQLLGEAV
jgi:DNA transposition AAA+ family ATPase